jgi:hypothetical protein
MFYIWVGILSCFCVYLYLWIYLPCIRENMHLLCFWSWPTSLTWYPPTASIYLQTTCHYSLWPTNTPLYMCTTISWSTISSPVGHQGCFQSLAIMNSAAMNISVQCLYCILFYIPVGRYLGVVVLDHMAVLSWGFWGISILLSIVVVLICIPTSSV